MRKEWFCCVWKPGYLCYVADHQLSIQTSEKSGATWCCKLATGCQEANFQTKPFGLQHCPFLPPYLQPPILFFFIALFHIYFCFYALWSVLHAMEAAALNADERLWKPRQCFVGLGLFGGLTCFTTASAGAWGQSQGDFSPLASGTLDQAV